MEKKGPEVAADGTFQWSKPDQKRIMIGIPSGETWKCKTAMAMINLMLHTTISTPFSVSINNYNSSILPVARDGLVMRALQWGATHICFIDSDMIFPAETVERLASHNELVVAANCVTKRIPAHTTARRQSEDKLGGEEVVHATWNPGDPELERVWRVGTGVMMISMEVFRKMPRPWFPIHWSEELGVYRGEDWSFCEKCDELGIPIYIDVPLGFAIKHTGQLDYDFSMIDLAG